MTMESKRQIGGMTAVLKDVESLRGFLCEQLDLSKDFNFKCKANANAKVMQQEALKMAVRKLIKECGMYPSREDKIELAKVLGDIFNQPSCSFFDEIYSSGKITNALAQYRHMYPEKCKKVKCEDNNLEGKNTFTVFITGKYVTLKLSNNSNF